MKEGSPYFLSSAVCDLYQRLDLFLVLWMGSFAVQGLYAAAVPAASMLQVGATALALFSFNSGSRQELQRVTPAAFKRRHHAGCVSVSHRIAVRAGDRAIDRSILRRTICRRGAVCFGFDPGARHQRLCASSRGWIRRAWQRAVGIMARIAGTVVMVMTVLLLFGRVREISIPIAATLANGLVAVSLTWYAFVFALREPPANAIGSEGHLP